MERELDIAAATSVGGWLRWRKKHAIEPGTPCANCETPLQGPYCYNCGQLAENFQRSIGHLFIEGLESFFHFDGRLWQTLPRLALKPGELTHDYVEGKRAYQIPPLRLFLVVLLIVFFVGGLNLGGGGKPHVNVHAPKPGEPVTIQNNGKSVQLNEADKKALAANAVNPKAIEGIIERAQAREQAKAAQNAKPALAPAPAPASTRASQAHPASAAPAKAESDDNDVNVDLFGTDKPGSKGRAAWLEAHIKKAIANPELFWMTVESWAHRLAFLMLPIAALLLSILYVFQRRFYIYDHLIFSMHSLSFQGLLLSAIILLGALTPWAWWLLLLAPVHLFVHMRGAYESSVFGALFRMTVLFWGSLIGFGVLMLGLLWLGLNAMQVA